MDPQHIDWSQADPIAIAANIINLLGPKKALKFVSESPDRFTKYQMDPVGFGEQVLGETYTDDVKAMMESVRDYEITVAMSCNGPGKTFGAKSVAIWFYFCFPGSKVYTAAAPPEDNLRDILWGEIGEAVRKNPALFDGHKITTLDIRQTPAHFLKGVAIPQSGDSKVREAKFAGKHAPYLLFVFDEGDAIPDEVYAGRESCTSGGLFRTLIMLNPRQPKGAVHRMVRDGQANVVHLSAFNHPNVITGENVIPGAVDRNTTGRRISQMCRLMQPDEPDSGDTFILPPFLEGFEPIDQKSKPLPPLMAGRYQVLESAFCHMVLGRYPSQGADQLISTDWILRARERWDQWVRTYGERGPAGADGIAGLDVGELGNDPSVICIRYGGFVSRFKDWHGVDTVYTGDKTIESVRDANVKCTMCDGNGVGAGVAPHMMRKGYPARGVKTQETPDDRDAEPEIGQFFILRDQLAWQLREWLRTEPGAMLPPDEELIEELSVPTYRVDGKWVKLMKADVFKDLLNRSPNKFSALCLTFAKPLDIGGVTKGQAVTKHKEFKTKYSRYGGQG